MGNDPLGLLASSGINALAETIIALHKTEPDRRHGPWNGIDEVDYATLECVDLFNHRQLLEPIGNVGPAEFEEASLRKEKAQEPAGERLEPPANPGAFQFILEILMISSLANGWLGAEFAGMLRTRLRSSEEAVR